MEKKKIAVLIINCLQGGGAERSVLTLGQGFFELGYDVHVLRFKPLVEYDLNPNLQYHLVKFKPYKLIPTDLKYSLFAKKIDDYILQKIMQGKGTPDIVLSNLERPDRVMSFSKLPNLLHVIRNTITQEYQLKTQSNRLATIKDLVKVYQSHPCVCISKGVKEDMNAVLGKEIETHTIYNPFDITNIMQMANQDIDFKELGISDSNYIVHVGSFKTQKAHDLLLKAYRQYIDSKSLEVIPLVLVGQGKLMEEMKQLAIDLDIDNKVIFAGFNKNPYPFIKHARFMVLSSRFEGFGRVIVESIAVNTPVISTDCPSGPKEILPETNLVERENIEALAKKMAECTINPERFHVDFDEQFLPKNIAKQYIELINDIKENKHI